MDKQSKIVTFIIPYFMAAIALVALLFGNNIVGKFFLSSNLVMESSIINGVFPNDIQKIINKDFDNDKINAVDSLRVIKIKNEGKSTKNLRITIQLDGPISSSQIESTEVVSKEEIVSESTFILTLNRLSHNATVDLKVWLKNEGNPLRVYYTDDLAKKEIIDIKSRELIYKTAIYTIGSNLLIVSFLLIISNYRKIKRKKDQEKENNIAERVLNKLSTMEQEIKEEQSVDKDDNTDSDETKERLKNLIRKSDFDEK
ncbi:UNVERIFIED_CONTAM: hypothetical protein N8J90_06120 [Halobacillus marinus]